MKVFKFINLKSSIGTIYLDKYSNGALWSKAQLPLTVI